MSQIDACFSHEKKACTPAISKFEVREDNNTTFLNFYYSNFYPHFGGVLQLKFLGTMTAAAFLFLFVWLRTQLISVESLQVSRPLRPSSILSPSSVTSSNRLSSSSLNESKDDSGNGDAEEIEVDWKAIASYVFDESIGSGDEQSTESEEPEPHLHSKPIILFDGVCNLCNGGVNFAIDHDRSAKFRFASLQSNVAKSLLLRDGKDPETTSDIVLVTSEKAYYSSDAVARIMSALDMPALKLLGILGRVSPSFARNAVYKVVSGNRFILGENDSCRMDFDGEYTSRFVSDPPESAMSGTTEED